MPYYRSVGEVPRKRHVRHRSAEGTMVAEELPASKRGFGFGWLGMSLPPRAVVVHRATEAHQGIVLVDTGPRGTRFTVLLPISPPPTLGSARGEKNAETSSAREQAIAERQAHRWFGHGQGPRDGRGSVPGRSPRKARTGSCRTSDASSRAPSTGWAGASCTRRTKVRTVLYLVSDRLTLFESDPLGGILRRLTRVLIDSSHHDLADDVVPSLR